VISNGRREETSCKGLLDFECVRSEKWQTISRKMMLLFRKKYVFGREERRRKT
jgi:hypothetical protein